MIQPIHSLLAALLLFPLAAHATIVTTTTDEDNGFLGGGPGISLREAVKYSPTGTHITFDPSLSGKTIGVFNGGITFPFGSPLTLIIDASNLPQPVILNAYNLNRIFVIPDSADVEMRSLRMMRAISFGEGGAITNLGKCALISCELSENSADFGGGAIFNWTSGTCSLTSCTLSGNVSPLGGGGAISNHGSLVMRSCTLSGNSSHTNGGGVSNTGSATLVSSTISGNWASTSGGGISNSGTFDLTFSIVAGNLAPTASNFIGFTPGGNNLLDGDPRLTPLGDYGGPVRTLHPLTGSPAIDAGGNTAPAATDSRGFPRLVDGDEDGNTALDFGAVEAGPLFTVDSSSDSDDSVSLRGKIISAATTPGSRIGFCPDKFPSETINLTQGALDIPDNANLFIDASNLVGPVTISGSENSAIFEIPTSATLTLRLLNIVDGRAPDNGGGIHAHGTCTVISCSLVGNSATSNGGGIYSTGNFDMHACTLIGNSATFGGGIFTSGSCSLRSSTLAGNSAHVGGGIYNEGECHVTSSTLSGNSACDEGGGISNGHGNLDVTFSIVARNKASSSSNISGSRTSNKVIIDVDPILSPLGDYGGPTKTMVPLPGSPAINSSVNFTRTTDQRGFPIGATADIGATEYQGASDIARFWPLDFDGDASPYGTEQALGTDPLVSDPANSRNITAPVLNASGHPVLSFGIGAAAPGTSWVLCRSTDLLLFTEIYRFNGSTDTAIPGVTFLRTATGVTVTDTTRPPGGVFYRFEAQFQN